ncbi:hypothetical protein AJ87_07015 [Rhizobium yanglingense]|nr:hypothetical protein AJ87_07015 [Rhizobium yanglingense]
MKVTVALKRQSEASNIRTVLEGAGEFDVVEVFNKERYATLNVTLEQYERLRTTLESDCTVQESLKALRF